MDEKIYTEDDLRQAFYKGREQACLPDEKVTQIFIRPTFNGYLRELDGQEDPYENFRIRSESLINNQDYDLETWKSHDALRRLQKNVLKKTVICAAFCGTGKTHICENTTTSAIEIEYWKYKDQGLHQEYIEAVQKNMGKVDYIFISTEPEGLKLLHKEGFDITLAYPENELRNEYLDRYIGRDSPYDFIGTFMKHWNLWINELKEQDYCKHLVLKEGQFLQDILDIKNKD